MSMVLLIRSIGENPDRIPVTKVNISRDNAMIFRRGRARRSRHGWTDVIEMVESTNKSKLSRKTYKTDRDDIKDTLSNFAAFIIRGTRPMRDPCLRAEPRKSSGRRSAETTRTVYPVNSNFGVRLNRRFPTVSPFGTLIPTRI